jgi:hypothetical protein
MFLLRLPTLLLLLLLPRHSTQANQSDLCGEGCSSSFVQQTL